MVKTITTRNTLVSLSLLAAMLLNACGTSAPVAEPPAAETQTPDTLAEPTAVAEILPATEAPAEPEPAPAPQADNASVSFSADVMPILQDSCISCHGGQRTSAGLDLKSYASLMSGGQDGLAVIPGDAASSPLVTLSESGKMPKRGSKLTPEQIQILKDWVNAGAPNN